MKNAQEDIRHKEHMKLTSLTEKPHQDLPHHQILHQTTEQQCQMMMKHQRKEPKDFGGNTDITGESIEDMCTNL